MSLISVRNVVAPLTNTTHMVAVVLVAVLFGALRLSNGAIHFAQGSGGTPKSEATVKERSSDSLNLSGLSPSKEILKFGSKSSSPSLPESGSVRLPANNAAPAANPPTARQKSGDDDLLTEMIGNEPLPENKNPDDSSKRRQIEKHGRSGESLDDIEKSLGLK